MKLLLALSLLVTTASQAQDDCSCVPNYRGPTKNLKWTVEYLNDFASPEQQKYFEEQVQKASDRWNAQFERRKVEARVTRDDESPTVTLIVDPDRTELPYNHSTHIDFGPDNLQPETLGTARVIADIQHEFGHSLGFDDAHNCNGSIMSQVNGYEPVTDLDFSECDLKMMFDANFNSPPESDDPVCSDDKQESSQSIY